VTAQWRRRRAGRRELIRRLHQDLMPLKSPNVLTILWWWRWEIGIILGIAAGLTFLITRFGWLTAPIVLGLAAALAGWPEAREWMLTHIRCIITAHRVRTGCAQAWIQTRSGRLPGILLTRPEPYGERVYIWCPAGICLQDFQDATEILCTACWATDLCVTASTRYPHIVIIDVIRE
jgi:hypothetical protein